MCLGRSYTPVAALKRAAEAGAMMTKQSIGYSKIFGKGRGATGCCCHDIRLGAALQTERTA